MALYRLLKAIGLNSSRRSAGVVFARNERGTVAMLCAFAIIPMVGMIAIGLDYARAQRVKFGLQAAAE